MFGYVRPLAQELKVREFERFKACYCGLCHELGREYGLPGRMILNYDFVFLAMLLWGGRGDCGYEYRRCVPGMCRKKCVCKSDRALTDAAGYSVILAYWKAEDAVRDSRGIKKLAAICVRAGMKRAYRKAAGRYPDFDGQVRDRLAELGDMERDRVESLDRPADAFARLLSSAAGAADEADRQAMAGLLYHVGRVIYIADGYADLAEDARRGLYNPVAARYGLSSGDAPEDVRESLLETMMASARLAAADWELLPVGYWTPVTENIVYLGIPDMIKQVLDGTYRTITKLPRSPKLRGQNGE